MSWRSEENPEEIAARLERDRADIARAFSALRDRILPAGGVAGGAQSMADVGADVFAAARAAGGKAAARLAGGAGDSAMRLAQTAGSAARANPLAAALAGGGLAWLAYSGVKAMRGRPAAPLPDWMIEAEALQERAAKLSARIDAAEAEGALEPRAAEDSREEVADSVGLELRRLMGQGLDGLEPQTRAAAFAAREEAWDRKHGKGRSFAGTLGKGSLLALAGAGLAAVLARQGSANGLTGAAAEAANAARAGFERAGFEGDAARLTALAAELSRSLNEALDALEQSGAARGDRES